LSLNLYCLVFNVRVLGFWYLGLGFRVKDLGVKDTVRIRARFRDWIRFRVF